MTFYTSGSCAHMDYERLGENITPRLAFHADEAHTPPRSPVALRFFRALVRLAAPARPIPSPPAFDRAPKGAAD